MKRSCIVLSAGILLAMNIVFMGSCSSSHKNENRGEDSLIVKLEEKGYEFSIIYGSKNARNALPYKKGEKYDTPLAINDSRAQRFKGVDTDDIWGIKMDGVPFYSVMLLNTTNDTIVIDSFEFPDTRFKATVATPVYAKGLLSTIMLQTDSMVNIKDYRFIINYKDDKYPPQTFHVNFYQDKASADKGYEERMSGE